MYSFIVLTNNFFIRIVDLYRSFHYDQLIKNPLNINKISEELQLDYKTIQHHIHVLEKNNFITKNCDKYGALYFISNYMKKNLNHTIM